MSSPIIIPANHPNWTYGDARIEEVLSICLDSTASGPPGIVIHYDPFRSASILLRARTIWVNYWDNPQNGDAEVIIRPTGGESRLAKLSSLVSYSTGGCVRQSLLGQFSALGDIWVTIRPIPPADNTNPNGQAFVFSGLQYAVESDPNSAQTSIPGTATEGPKYVPSVPTPDVVGTQKADPPSPPQPAPSGNSGGHSHLAAMLGGILGGVLAMVALLSVLLMLRRRRRKQARQMAFDPDWPDHPLPVRTVTRPHDTGSEQFFSAVPTQDPDECPSDAPIGSPSIAPDEAASFIPSTCLTTPLPMRDSKLEILSAPQEQGLSTPGGTATSSASRQQRLSTSTGNPHGVTAEITWEEPPPEYST